MGTVLTKENESEAKFNIFISNLEHIGKTKIDSLSSEVDLFRPMNLEFQEDLIVIVENCYGESEKIDDWPEKTKQSKENRSKIKNRHISELLYSCYFKTSGLCADRITAKFAFEYSNTSLELLIRKRTNVKTNVQEKLLSKSYPNSDQVIHLLASMVEALLAFSKINMSHGFVKPSSILVYNQNSINPLYKLFDSGIISEFHKLNKKCR